MSEAPTASIVARFDGNDAGLGLSIEPDSGVFADGFVHLLLHPYDTTIILRASVGEVAATDSKLVTVPGGMLSFKGSAAAALPKRPHDTPPQLQVVFAFSAEGEVITDDVVVSYNADSNVVTLDVECDAVVKYSQYKTRSRKVIYKPLISDTGAGTLTQYGVIAAYHPPTKSRFIYEVQFPVLVEHADVEIYRISSEYVITPNGPREKPPNYPKDGIYPDMPPSLHLDVATTILAEVAHEVGFMTASGNAYVRSYNQPIHEPYVGFFNYKRPRKLQPSPLGDKYPDDIRLKAKSIVAALGLGKI